MSNRVLDMKWEWKQAWRTRVPLTDVAVDILFLEFWSIWQVFSLSQDAKSVLGAFSVACQFVGMKLTRLPENFQLSHLQHLVDATKVLREEWLLHFPTILTEGTFPQLSTMFGVAIPVCWSGILLFDGVHCAVLPKDEFFMLKSDAATSSSISPSPNCIPSFVSSSVSSVAFTAFRGVCLIRCGTKLATGCVVHAGKYVLTNAHVLKSPEDASRAFAVFDFDYPKDISFLLAMDTRSGLSSLRGSTVYRLDPLSYFCMSPSVSFAVPNKGNLDFCLVQLGAQVDQIETVQFDKDSTHQPSNISSNVLSVNLSARSSFSGVSEEEIKSRSQQTREGISLSACYPEIGQEVILIGHCFGFMKRMSHGRITQVTKYYFRYSAPTRPGMSGACVLVNGNLCGIHQNSLVGTYNQGIALLPMLEEVYRATGLQLASQTFGNKESRCVVS